MSVSRLHEVLAYCTTADEFYKHKDNIIRELSRLYDMSDAISLASHTENQPTVAPVAYKVINQYFPHNADLSQVGNTGWVKFDEVSIIISQMIDEKDKQSQALARRDAAAGEPVGTVIGYAVNGVVVRGNGLKIGDSVFTAAQPAALPPEAETHNAPDLGWFERNCWVAGANWMREQTKALGLKPIKLSESSVQRRAQIVRTLQSQGFTVEGE